MKLTSLLLILTSSLLFYGCPNCDCCHTDPVPDDNPGRSALSLVLTSVPAYGNTTDPISGRLISHAKAVDFSEYGVAVYLYTRNIYVLKPGGASDLIQIDQNGDWFCYAYQGPGDDEAEHFVVFALPIWFDPPDCYPDPCPDLPAIHSAVAIAACSRLPFSHAKVQTTSIPPRGSFGQMLTGTVSGVRPQDFGLAVFIRVNQRWVLKPGGLQNLIEISPDSSWFCYPIQGDADRSADQFALLLVPRWSEIPTCYPAMCAELPPIPLATASTIFSR